MLLVIQHYLNISLSLLQGLQPGVRVSPVLHALQCRLHQHNLGLRSLHRLHKGKVNGAVVWKWTL